jgi:hypothetical protein
MTARAAFAGRAGGSTRAPADQFRFGVGRRGGRSDLRGFVADWAILPPFRRFAGGFFAVGGRIFDGGFLTPGVIRFDAAALRSSQPLRTASAPRTVICNSPRLLIRRFSSLICDKP